MEMKRKLFSLLQLYVPNTSRTYIYIHTHLHDSTLYVIKNHKIPITSYHFIISYHISPTSFQVGEGGQRREKEREKRETERERELWLWPQNGLKMAEEAIIVAVALATEWAQDQPCHNHCSCSFGHRWAQDGSRSRHCSSSFGHRVGSRSAMPQAAALATHGLNDESCNNHCSCSFGHRVGEDG